MTGITDLDIEDDVDDKNKEESLVDFRKAQENSQKIIDFCENSGISVSVFEMSLALTCLIASLCSFTQKTEEEMQHLCKSIVGIKKIYDQCYVEMKQVNKDD